MKFFSYLTPVAVVAHEALSADAVPHVLAAAHLRGALGADLVAAGVHLPPVPAEVDVVNSHVPVELAASVVVDIKLFCVIFYTPAR